MLSATRFALQATAGFLMAIGAGAQSPQTAEEMEVRLKTLEARVARLEEHAGLNKAPAAETPPAAPVPDQSYIVPELMLKKIHGTEKGGDGELRFYLRLTNNFGKDVSSLEGLFVVEDLSGARVMEFAAAIDKRIVSGKAESWVGAIDIDRADEGHAKAMRMSKEDTRVKLILKKVVFADGTTQSFAAR